MKLASSFFSLIAIAAAAPAQNKAPLARHFLFDGYTTAMSLDMKQMRESGVWDDINVSAMKMVMGMIEAQYGFPMKRLDRVTLVRERAGEGQPKGMREVITVEGNEDLGQTRDAQTGRYNATEVGHYSVLVDQWSPNHAMVEVTPKLRVLGPPDLLTEVLEGKPRNGLPSGDVMSFTAAKKGMLGYIVADLEKDDSASAAMKDVFDGAEWPADDKPTFVCIRLSTIGDEDDLHLKLELVIRHAKDGAGLVASEKAVTDAIKKVKGIKETRILWPLLKKVEHKRDRTDAIWHVDLGRARNVGGMLGTLAPFMFFATAAEVAPAKQVQVLQVEEVVEEAEEVKPKPKPAKKKAKKVEVTRGGGNGN